MKGRIKKQNKLTSIRMAEATFDWFASYADNIEVPVAYVIRNALKEYMANHSNDNKQ